MISDLPVRPTGTPAGSGAIPGGGGYIRITRTAPENENLILHIVGAVGDSISATSSNAIIKELYAAGLITQKEAKIIMAALSDSSLIIQRPERDIVRAKMLKNILKSNMNGKSLKRHPKILPLLWALAPLVCLRL